MSLLLLTTSAWLGPAAFTQPGARLLAEHCTFFLPKKVEPLFKAGDYGGNVTISLLEVDITAEHHGSMFVCEAKNEALGQSVHNAMTISVNCE